jgi:CRP-like cAMP-binding protein
VIKHKIFENLTKDEYDKFIKIWHKFDIKDGEILSKEGKVGDDAFILLEGKISVIKETLYNEDYIVTEIEAGGDEIFGEVSLIDQGQKNSTIKAIKQCKILKINHKDLFDFMNKNPSIGYKVLFVILENCIKYLRKADKDVVSLFNALVEVVEND